MPSMRIISWNSTGESYTKGQELQQAQAWLAGNYIGANPDVDVFVIQEAQNSSGGPIYTMMNTHPANLTTLVTLGGNINRPPDHSPEKTNGGGAGYLCCTHTNVTINTNLTLWDYAADGTLTGWLGRLGYKEKLAMQAAAAQRPPAYAEFTVGGTPVFLITWHAPLGVSQLNAETMPGNGLVDAFCVMENSGLLPRAQAYAGQNGVVIIAGDLNTTAVGLKKKYWNVYRPLINFAGLGHHLDHILAWKPGLGNPTVDQGHNSTTSSVHNMISARVSW
jgi:hypothetical protein